MALPPNLALAKWGRELSKPVHLRQGEGFQFHFGADPVVNVHSDWVGGQYLVFEHEVAPRLLGMPHSHQKEDQVAIILKGTLGFYVDGEEFIAHEGDSVFRPRALTHTLWNPTDNTARMLEITSPGSFEGYFRKLDEMFGKSADAEEIMRYQAEWGITNSPELVADLEARHGVKLI